MSVAAFDYRLDHLSDHTEVRLSVAPNEMLAKTLHQFSIYL